VVPSRADNVTHSPGGIVVSLRDIRDQHGVTQADSSQRFYVHEFWWVQDIPNALQTYSTVLCIKFLVFRERKKEKEKKRKIALQLVGQHSYHTAVPGFPGLLCAIKS
jgi:hypothetical protein